MIVSKGFLTKERNTRWVARMQSLSVLAKVLRASHDASHALQDVASVAGNLIPSSLQASDGCCS